MATKEYFIGLMSGTSLDGIDAVLVEYDEQKNHLCETVYRPFREDMREHLLALCTPGDNEIERAGTLANDLAREYGITVRELLRCSALAKQHVRAVGCHGQTIRHCPDQGFTVQIVNSALLAELCGVTVVSDFRSRDIAAGGHGAPLVPAFHDAMFRSPSAHRAIVNIGGIANVTNLEPGRATAGFDSGPGNILLNAWAQRHLGQPFDKDGKWAASGTIDTALLGRLLEEPYLAALPPKSTGRELFNLSWLDQRIPDYCSPRDVQATLTEFTALTIARALCRYCTGTTEAFLCGGGVHNAYLIARLSAALPELVIRLTGVLGIEADWVEAMAFAWLARETLARRPGNLPAVTGARGPRVLGAIYPA